jgi:hypothetical protein
LFPSLKKEIFAFSNFPKKVTSRLICCVTLPSLETTEESSQKEEEETTEELVAKRFMSVI